MLKSRLKDGIRLLQAAAREVRKSGRKLLKDGKWPQGLRWGAFHFGFCPICESSTLFSKSDSWLRDNYHCLRCRSIPRFRMLVHVLETHFPKWRGYSIHESSPGGSSSEKLRNCCSNYIASQFFPDVQAGQIHRGFRCENLECQTFGDAEFDMVVTQDVFEHVFDPRRAFAEVARTLKPGGCHVFTSRTSIVESKQSSTNCSSAGSPARACVDC